MIADLLARLGIPAAFAKGVVVLVFAFLAAAVPITFPGSPYDGPLVALITGLAVLIDPNAGHGGPVG